MTNTVATKTEPGFYLSDIDPESKQHLFIYRTNPTRIFCIGCFEMCTADPEAAKAFTAKHGYLGERVAFRLEPWVTRWQDGDRHWAQDGNGNTVCITEPFEIDPKVIRELE